MSYWVIYARWAIAYFQDLPSNPAHSVHFLRGPVPRDSRRPHLQARSSTCTCYLNCSILSSLCRDCQARIVFPTAYFPTAEHNLFCHTDFSTVKET